MTSVRNDRPSIVHPAATAESPAAPASCGLDLTVHHPRPGWVLLRAHGEIDLNTVDQLCRLLGEVGRGPDPAKGPQPRHVVCDLGGVTFLGAAGVGALARASGVAQRRGTALTVVASSRPVRRVLELCGLDHELSIARRLTDATDDVSDQSPTTVPVPRSAS